MEEHGGINFDVFLRKMVTDLKSDRKLVKKAKEHLEDSRFEELEDALAEAEQVATKIWKGEKQPPEKSENAIRVIEPYKDSGIWMFDDEGVGLNSEPFVSGIPEMIEQLIRQKSIENAEDGFALTFSHLKFPDYDVRLIHKREDGGGHWYLNEMTGAEGWLCPALFRYFDEAPDELYAKAESIE